LAASELQAIYVMWLREMKRFIRSKSRILGMIIQPIFFLVILGSGFSKASIGTVQEGEYINFLAPGIVTMAILFSSMFTGISVLWDRQFGFLQEVLVAPISRFSIILGRTLGGATTALIQGFIILGISLALGIKISSIFGLLLTIVFMIMVAFTAVGFGLVIASRMENFQGFQIIMNLIIMPLLFLSSAFFPVNTIPQMQTIAHFNPMFYMVDGLRGSLTGTDYIYNPLLNLGIVFVIMLVMMIIGSYSFSKCEA